ncbi:MAG: bifunctional phosphoribosylaminoimidazolecarboxamide formyltransferase/IMP cyclohydrolase [Candidatus Brocadiales bacterium]
MPTIRRALISVYDKRGVVEFAKGIAKLGVELISSGGTAKLLRENGLKVTEVSEYTGFPEMMDGRVKTLHPKVHGGLLALRDSAVHVRQMKEHGILPIDMVVVNLYPFEKTIAKEGVTMEEAIENIDIGGPSMIRSAAKNHKHVAVVVDPDQYASVLEEMEKSNGRVSEGKALELATRAFRLVAHYDSVISRFLAGEAGDAFPQKLSLEFLKKQGLRYGENPHQAAAFYVEAEGITEPCVSRLEQLWGKELSFNNILDLDAALELVKEFEAPGAVVIKHTNPCGAGVAQALSEAFHKAYSGDPVSAFGSVIGLNNRVDAQTAEEIAAPGHFIEAVVAPDFTSGALEILKTRRKWGANLRILRAGELARVHPGKKISLDMKRVVGGLLVQTRDVMGKDLKDLRCVTTKKPSQEELSDLRLAWIVAKHVKSNAIVLVRDGTLVGVGAGQMSRVDSVEMAVKKASDRAKGSVLASDAFFPFRDGVDIAARGGVVAIIQPGGSTKDEEVIAAAKEHGIAMVFTGQRHFRH